MTKNLKKTILAATLAILSVSALNAPAEAGGFRKHGFNGGGFSHGFHGGHSFNKFGHRKCGFFKFGRFIPCR